MCDYDRLIDTPKQLTPPRLSPVRCRECNKQKSITGWSCLPYECAMCYASRRKEINKFSVRLSKDCHHYNPSVCESCINPDREDHLEELKTQSPLSSSTEVSTDDAPPADLTGSSSSWW